MLYAIVGIIIFVAMIIGGTTAFYVAVARTDNNSILLGSNKFAVVMDSDGPIDGALPLAIGKEDGLWTTVRLKMASDSVLSKANLYINIEDISNNMINNGRVSWKKALIWELYGHDESNNQVLIDTGNFLECSDTGAKTCVNGDKLYMFKDFQLTYEYQNFTVYVWLDGNIADNGVEDAYVKATVSAETEEFSADLRQYMR